MLPYALLRRRHGHALIAYGLSFKGWPFALAALCVGNAVVLLPAGRYSDRLGRKPFLIIGSAVCGTATIAMGIGNSLAVFFVMSFVAGLGSGLINPAQQAAVADIVGKKLRDLMSWVDRPITETA